MTWISNYRFWLSRIAGERRNEEEEDEEKKKQ